MGSRLSLSARVTWAGVTLLVLFSAVSTALLLAFRDSVYGEKRESIVQTAEIGAGIVAGFAEKAARGELPEADARRLAIEAIKGIRYSGKEYFWVSDLEARMVMHPIKPDMDGKDQRDYADPNGKRVFVEMADVCRRAGRGFVEYEWPKTAGGEPVSKFSYVILVPAWGWVVGTGVYVDDVEEQLATAGVAFGSMILLAFVGGAAGLWYVRRSLVAPLRGLASQFAEGAGQVDDAAREVATGAAALSRGATDQAAALEETSASMEEMASMTRKNAENSGEAARQVAETDRLVGGANTTRDAGQRDARRDRPAPAVGVIATGTCAAADTGGVAPPGAHRNGRLTVGSTSPGPGPAAWPGWTGHRERVEEVDEQRTC